MANQVSDFMAKSGSIPNIYDPKDGQTLSSNGSISKRTTMVTNGTTFTLPAIPLIGTKHTIVNNSVNTITIQSNDTIGNLPTGNPTSITLKSQEWLDVVSDGAIWRII